MKKRRNWIWKLILAATAIAVVGGIVIACQLRSPTALYAQVAFGPKPGDRLGFVARGVDLYVDEDLADGIQPAQYLGTIDADLPHKFQSSDGSALYRNISASLLIAPHAVSDRLPQQLAINADVESAQSFSLSGEISMVEDSDKARLLSIDRTFKIRPPDGSIPRRLVAGGAAADIRVAVCAVNQNGQIEVVVNSDSRADGSVYAFPSGVGPEVEIEFSAQSTGEPIVKRFVLDAFC